MSNNRISSRHWSSCNFLSCQFAGGNNKCCVHWWNSCRQSHFEPFFLNDGFICVVFLISPDEYIFCYVLQINMLLLLITRNPPYFTLSHNVIIPVLFLIPRLTQMGGGGGGGLGKKKIEKPRIFVIELLATCFLWALALQIWCCADGRGEPSRCCRSPGMGMRWRRLSEPRAVPLIVPGWNYSSP